MAVIPDAPGLPEWVKAHAEHDGRYAQVVDAALVIAVCNCPRRLVLQHGKRFRIGASSQVLSDHAPGCPALAGEPMTLWLVAQTDDYAEALAVWQKHADALAGREGD